MAKGRQDNMQGSIPCCLLSPFLILTNQAAQRMKIVRAIVLHCSRMKKTYRLYWGKSLPHTVIETENDVIIFSHREWLIGRAINELKVENPDWIFEEWK
jgi:hypothetical protein